MRIPEDLPILLLLLPPSFYPRVLRAFLKRSTNNGDSDLRRKVQND